MTAQGIALVTGGTRGIGRVISEGLRERGHHVVAVARSIPDEPLPGIDVRICDITDESAVTNLVAELGRVDILVNNAGVASANALAKTTLAEWNRNIAVNATGAFLCTRSVVPAMVERGAGHVITVASTASLEGAKYVAAYTASKHAVLGLMRVVAAEVEGSGVVVSTVCPTFVRTQMTLSTIANIATRTGVTLEEAEVKLATATPHGRILEIDEVAACVFDLVADGVNGQEVLLTGEHR